MFVYLDESGSFGRDGGKFFIVGSYTVGDPKRIANSYRRWQRRKFPKKLRVLSEVKFNEPLLTDDLKIGFVGRWPVITKAKRGETSFTNF
jgi:hypothetical protein